MMVVVVVVVEKKAAAVVAAGVGGADALVGGRVEREVVVARDDELQRRVDVAEELQRGLVLGQAGVGREVAAVDDHVDRVDRLGVREVAVAVRVCEDEEARAHGGPASGGHRCSARGSVAEGRRESAAWRCRWGCCSARPRRIYVRSKAGDDAVEGRWRFGYLPP